MTYIHTNIHDRITSLSAGGDLDWLELVDLRSFAMRNHENIDTARRQHRSGATHYDDTARWLASEHTAASSLSVAIRTYVTETIIAISARLRLWVVGDMFWMTVITGQTPAISFVYSNNKNHLINNKQSRSGRLIALSVARQWLFANIEVWKLF